MKNRYELYDKKLDRVFYYSEAKLNISLGIIYLCGVSAGALVVYIFLSV